jgi:hypothetical protein
MFTEKSPTSKQRVGGIGSLTVPYCLTSFWEIVEYIEAVSKVQGSDPTIQYIEHNVG